GARLTPPVCPTDLEARASGAGGCDPLPGLHLGPLRRQPLELLGDVDNGAGMVAVEELVPEQMGTRPARVAVGAEDLGVADRDHGALSDRDVVDPHVDPALVPACGLEGIDVAIVIVAAGAGPAVGGAGRACGEA